MVRPISKINIDCKNWHVSYDLQNNISWILKDKKYDAARQIYNKAQIARGTKLFKEDSVKICNKLKTDDKFFIKVCTDTFYYLTMFASSSLNTFMKIFRQPNVSISDIHNVYLKYESDVKHNSDIKDSKKLKETRIGFIYFIRNVTEFYDTFDNFFVFGDDFEFVKECQCCNFKSFKKAVGEYLQQHQEILLESPASATRFVEIEFYSEYFDNDFCIKLLEGNKIYPKTVLNNHKFTEEEIIRIIDNCKMFTSKAYVMGGSQQQRQNACNHIIKTQTVTLPILKKILEKSFPEEEELFLKSLGTKAILIKDLPLDDDLVLKMIDAGTSFKYVDTSKLSSASQLIIEVSK